MVHGAFAWGEALGLVYMGFSEVFDSVPNA